MNHQFLVRPAQLNQAFESNRSSGSSDGNGSTRRSFIKRAGGATVATVVAWNAITQKSEAFTLFGVSWCWHKWKAIPKSEYSSNMDTSKQYYHCDKCGSTTENPGWFGGTF